MPLVADKIEVANTEEVQMSEFFGEQMSSVLSCPQDISIVHAQEYLSEKERPWQTPEFDTYVLVLRGEMSVRHGRRSGKECGVSDTTTVRSGTGVLLPKGLRQQWAFPEFCEYVAICQPAFSLAKAHREATAPTTATAAGGQGGPLGCLGCFAGVREAFASGIHSLTSLHEGGDLQPTSVAPVPVVKADDLTIVEFFGNVASGDPDLSACVARVGKPCVEAYQTPDFDEFVLVLEGQVNLRQQVTTFDAFPHATVTERVTEVKAGQGCFLAKGERVRWEWPVPTVYLPICLPAFTPAGCHREEDAGAAKGVECMKKLEELHVKAGSMDPAAAAESRILGA